MLTEQFILLNQQIKIPKTKMSQVFLITDIKYTYIFVITAFYSRIPQSSF